MNLFSKNKKERNSEIRFVLIIIALMILCVFATYFVGCTSRMDIQGNVYACRVKDWVIVDRYGGKDTVMLLERMDNKMEFYVYKTSDNQIWPVNSIVPMAVLSSFKRSFR